MDTLAPADTGRNTPVDLLEARPNGPSRTVQGQQFTEDAMVLYGVVAYFVFFGTFLAERPPAPGHF